MEPAQQTRKHSAALRLRVPDNSPSPPPDSSIVLYIDPHCACRHVSELADIYDLPRTNNRFHQGLLLRLTPGGLELCRPDDPELAGGLRVDFEAPRFRRRWLHPGRELLVRAAKVHRHAAPLIIDATAGLGRDAFLLAAAGYRVHLFERHPIIAALLGDGLQRAARSPQIAAITARMHLTVGDVVDFFSTINEQPEVIYLDPMFPERSKSAKVKQELRLLQLLPDHKDDAEQLLQAALALQAKKVVVKRPLKGPFLLTLPPTYSLRGKAVRFDIYVGAIQSVPPL
jgi:16S rRNA (guanine1516-N2)-methyltransferase